MFGAGKQQAADVHAASTRDAAVALESENLPTLTPRFTMRYRLALVSGVGPPKRLIGTAVRNAVTD